MGERPDAPDALRAPDVAGVLSAMPYCAPAMLDDLADVLAEVRAWPGITEKKRGIFYVRREPFLHFHLVDGGRRRADIKGRAGWTQVDLPRPASATRQRAFLRELRTCFHDRSRQPGGHHGQ